MCKAFAAIDPEAREALEADIHALLDKFNIAKDGTLVVPSEYLEVVITKSKLMRMHVAFAAHPIQKEKSHGPLCHPPSERMGKLA